jgi:hypothetical protein
MRKGKEGIEPRKVFLNHKAAKSTKKRIMSGGLDAGHNHSSPNGEGVMLLPSELIFVLAPSETTATKVSQGSAKAAGSPLCYDRQRRSRLNPP